MSDRPPSSSYLSSLITLKENVDFPPLDYPEINCDVVLHEKLLKLVLYKNMAYTHCTMYIGTPGSGKTSIVEAQLRTPEYFNGVINKIYLIMPTSSRKSVTDSIFDYLPESQKFEGLNLETLHKLEEEIVSNRARDPPWTSLIIMDDVQKDMKGEAEKELWKLIANRRHYRCSFWIIVQNYIAVPRMIRKLCTDLFCFDLSMAEFEAIYHEHAKFYKQVWEEILNYYVQRVRAEKEKKESGQPYEKVFLYLNVPNKEVFVNFDEVLFDKTNVQVEVVKGDTKKRKRLPKIKDESDENGEDSKSPTEPVYA
jgi:hypothetical protein